MDYERIQKSFSSQKITSVFFDSLKAIIISGIDEIKSLDLLDDLEVDIIQFCREQKIIERDSNSADKIDIPGTDSGNDYISQDVLGENERGESFSRTIFKKMLQLVKESLIR